MKKVAVNFRSFAKEPEKETEVLEPNATHNVEYIWTNHAEVAWRIPMDWPPPPYTSPSSGYTFPSSAIHYIPFQS